MTTSAASADDEPLDENPRLSRVGVIDAIDFEVEPQHDATARAVTTGSRISSIGASNPLRAKRFNIDRVMHSSATDAPALPKRPSSRATSGRRKAGSHGRGSILHLHRDGNLRGIVARNALKFKAADAALTLTAKIDTTSDSVPDVLPPGWEEHVAEDGDSYYHNEGTNKTVWTRPTIESVDEGSLLPGWEEHIAENGESYYHKEATNETVWARPTAQNNALSATSALARNFWWSAEHLSLGTQVTHKTRGAGTVVLLETEGLQRVHVEFASGEKHRYKKESWSKLFTAYDIFAQALV